MKNTEPGFWRYFAAYLMICVGTALIALNIAGWVFFGEKESLATGLITIWFGIIALHSAKKAHPRQDNNSAEKK